MKIRFQADANLDPDIGLGLQRRERAVDYRLAQGVILDAMQDPHVLDLAAEDGRVLVTNDLRMPKHFAEFIAFRDSPGLLLVPPLVDRRNNRRTAHLLAVVDGRGNAKSDPLVTALMFTKPLAESNQFAPLARHSESIPGRGHNALGDSGAFGNRCSRELFRGDFSGKP